MDALKRKLEGMPYDIKGIDEEISIVDYDLIILSGGRQHEVLNHEEFYKNELALVRSIREDGPRLLGICLGFELIAHTFGSTLELLNPKEPQNVEVRVIRDDPIFKNISHMTTFESHRWRVHNLSGDLIPLADSDYGIEAVRHKTLPLYGFQFHPEVVIDENPNKILWNNILTPDGVQVASRLENQKFK